MLNFHFHNITIMQKKWRRTFLPDPTGRSGKNDITGRKNGKCADISNEKCDAVYHIRRGVPLNFATI
ncbi:hypothetical protein T643_A1506 [Klebsiella pneumoniae MRSN 1319]|nr:hypothetical protein T643_A1506 [Klebsiella pneumoniae MRSN 1319]